MNRVVFHLGSNIGRREIYIKKAIESLEEIIGTLIIFSSVYESEPWGFDANIDFLNQVIIIDTNFTAFEVLEKTQKIESDFGRVKNTKAYESRIIDIDILFFNDEIIDTKRLKIPHHHISKRKFVLKPLCEILPTFIHPTENKKIKTLLEECSDNSKVYKL